MKEYLNKMYVGLVIGVLSPSLFLSIIYLFKYIKEYSIAEIIAEVERLGLESKIVALSVFSMNLVIFYVFYRLKWDKLCKGVLWATILYAFLVITMKY